MTSRSSFVPSSSEVLPRPSFRKDVGKVISYLTHQKQPAEPQYSEQAKKAAAEQQKGFMIQLPNMPHHMPYFVGAPAQRTEPASFRKDMANIKSFVTGHKNSSSRSNSYAGSIKSYSTGSSSDSSLYKE